MIASLLTIWRHDFYFDTKILVFSILYILLLHACSILFRGCSHVYLHLSGSFRTWESRSYLSQKVLTTVHIYTYLINTILI